MNHYERETCLNIASLLIGSPDGYKAVMPDELQILARGFMHACEAHDKLIEDCIVTDPLCRREADAR